MRILVMIVTSILWMDVHGGMRFLDNIREIHEGSYPIYRLLTLMKNHFRMAISLQSDVFQTISRD